MTALRVVQIDAGRAWRGGQNQVRLLARALAREPGVDQLLVTRAGTPLAERAAAHGITVLGTPWGPGFDVRAVLGLVGAIRRFAPHVLHAHESHALRVALVARWVARLRGARRPAVVASRRTVFAVRSAVGWRAADHVIAISDAVRRALIASGVTPERVSVVFSGIDPEEVRGAAARAPGARRRLGLPLDAPLAVSVAALTPEKDHATLLAAARRVADLRPDVHWALAGEGRLRGALERAAAALGLGDRVRFLGYVEEVDALIREANVLVVSSTAEGLGSVALHALALGTPVVATRAGGLPELLPPDALVPVGDAAGLAGKVVAALAHPVPVPLPQRFTAAAMAADVLARYRTLASCPPPPHD